MFFLYAATIKQNDAPYAARKCCTQMLCANAVRKWCAQTPNHVCVFRPRHEHRSFDGSHPVNADISITTGSDVMCSDHRRNHHNLIASCGTRCVLITCLFRKNMYDTLKKRDALKTQPEAPKLFPKTPWKIQENLSRDCPSSEMPITKKWPGHWRLICWNLL